jgi:threonine aldolase
MSITATVINDTIKLPEGTHLEDGTLVEVMLLAYLEDGLWLQLAARANAHAQRLAGAAGDLLLQPVEANEVFVHPGADGIAALRAQGFAFYDWGSTDSGEARFVVSWDQPDRDVDALCTALEGLRSS